MGALKVTEGGRFFYFYALFVGNDPKQTSNQLHKETIIIDCVGSGDAGTASVIGYAF